MAVFEKAYFTYVKPWEGYYANVAGDKGLETYAGITKKNFPDWEGFKVIDAYKRARGGSLPNNFKIPELENMVTDFYLSRLWTPNGFGKIQNQEIANLLFDFFVNSGTGAITSIQKIVGATPDGVMGPATISAINSADSKKVYDALLNARKNWFVRIVERDPTQKKFLAGWLNRLSAFPQTIMFAGIGLSFLFLLFFFLIILN